MILCEFNYYLLCFHEIILLNKELKIYREYDENVKREDADN